MENSELQPRENLVVATFDPTITYAGASNLQLSETEMKNLSAPFDDLEYELTPQGFIYLPQSISLKRMNDVIGIGKWGLLLINVGQQKMNNNVIKVFYDGALMIRNCFVSRAVGEASYATTNQNQSYATALEAAKTDCRTRCCKDLGIANDAWNPSFTRAWQKKYAIRVQVRDKDGKLGIIWRRKDLDPYPNEVGLAPDRPMVPKTGDAAPATELPWLNEATPEYDQQLKLLLEGKTIGAVKKEFRISKKNEELLTQVLRAEWQKRLDTCSKMEVLTESYNNNSAEVIEYPWLKEMFRTRRDQIKKPVTAKV
jgi:hypothetical protein